MFGYILEKLTYGGYRLRIQSIGLGEHETITGFDALDLVQYANQKYPGITDLLDTGHHGTLGVLP